MNETFAITREIGIDMAHRIPDHASKCRNLHGHRYVVQATCVGELDTGGSSAGMVLDFSFLKELMMDHIDKPYDHGMAIYHEDPLLERLTGFVMDWQQVRQLPISSVGTCGKVVVVPYIPTAENMARLWWEALAPGVLLRSSGRARLASVRVYETVNCWADYPAKNQ